MVSRQSAEVVQAILGASSPLGALSGTFMAVPGTGAAGESGVPSASSACAGGASFVSVAGRDSAASDDGWPAPADTFTLHASETLRTPREQS